MALLGTIPKVDAVGSFSGRFELACRLLERGAHAGAYQLFAGLHKEQEYHVAALYNLALCQVAASEWELALRLLERAYNGLRKNTVGAAAYDDTYKALAARQAQGRGYLFPLPESAPGLAPEYTRECVIRLLVDVCYACGLRDKVSELAAQLPGQQYINVQKALENTP